MKNKWKIIKINSFYIHHIREIQYQLLALNESKKKKKQYNSTPPPYGEKEKKKKSIDIFFVQ